MVSLIIPIVGQSKTDLIHRQVMRPLRHGGSHFVNLRNGCLHDVRDASLVCGLSQFLTAWRLVFCMKPWSYIWLEFGHFSTIIAIIRTCACWALFVETLTNTVHLIYIYIYGLTKWLPPWRKGRISCLWIKSVFYCLTIGIIHETMVVQMTWVCTFFNNYIYIPDCL